MAGMLLVNSVSLLACSFVYVCTSVCTCVYVCSCLFVNCVTILVCMSICLCMCLRHSATNGKVVGSIPYDVIELFH